MTKTYTLILVLFCTSISFLSFAEQVSSGLTVQVTGAKQNTGQVFLSLFTSSENYLKDPVFQESLPVDDKGEARFSIDDLDAGTYSVSVFYDQDNNGKLNTGFLRIPKEPVGFSNNAKGRFGPPGFDKTSFYFEGSKTVSIDLVNVK